jgi:protein-tyrosine phosphatase
MQLGHIDVEGCLNFRDAGGWELPDGSRMRAATLYRSDDPIRLTPRGRTTVEALGLHRVIDLRQHSQHVRSAGFLPPERTDHVSLVDRVLDVDSPPRLAEPEDMTDLYETMLERSHETLGRVLDLAARHLQDGPVLVHCAYGKDRAGLVTALIQAAIGLPAEAIAADYARSQEPTVRRRAWALAEPLPDDPPTMTVPPILFTAREEVMTELLARALQRHGTLVEWAARFAPEATIELLRGALIEA